ncbi:sulfurtransferase [Tepidicella baoligensis]|uniref:sulfurtransferase n=1 Tax=Tepidicella baoligensis TaxID=2707016 RepID=UPI0015DB4B39|nr:sulfurtransferase [Tepidicella baoligensis]
MTPYTTLITAEQLMALQTSGQPLMVFDCSADLMNPQAGDALYAEAHIPGAVHMHLERDLSDLTGCADAASGGRHPLPSREAFADRLRSKGFGAGMQAVVYDRQGMQYCGRLWWMLKWCGHEPVAVLDGGLPAWRAAGGAIETGQPAATPTPGDFTLGTPLAPTIDARGLACQLGAVQQTIIDARAPARYRGETEPLDPVAGHIPGALNRPFSDNFLSDGRFKPAAQLRAEFDTLLAGREPSGVVHHCGSGVTAVPNLLAMELAGLGRTTLFPGSWSEWCNTPGLPCARG